MAKHPKNNYGQFSYSRANSDRAAEMVRMAHFALLAVRFSEQVPQYADDAKAAVEAVMRAQVENDFTPHWREDDAVVLLIKHVWVNWGFIPI